MVLFTVYTHIHVNVNNVSMFQAVHVGQNDNLLYKIIGGGERGENDM